MDPPARGHCLKKGALRIRGACRKLTSPPLALHPYRCNRTTQPCPLQLRRGLSHWHRSTCPAKTASARHSRRPYPSGLTGPVGDPATAAPGAAVTPGCELTLLMAGTRTPLLALLVVAAVLLAREAAAGEPLGRLPVQCSGQGCDPSVHAVRKVCMNKNP